jgi:hypothetical protein
MKHTKKMKRLLQRMAEIERMERGKLCRMGARPHYNHQRWEKGKNVVRYVPAKEREFLQEAIEGYQTFMKLAESFADEVIRQTRREREKAFRKPREKSSPNRAHSSKDKKIDS